MLSIPNLFTVVRIALIPVFVLVFYLPWESSKIIAATIFAIAAITDWLDGYLARKLQQTSRLGAFLDPVADKLLVACALVMIAVEFDNFFITIPAMIIVCREVAISALREWMAEVGERAKVAVSYWGKAKTVLQLTSIFVLISQTPQWDKPWVWAGVILMYGAVLLTIWSMVDYLKAAANTLQAS